MKVIVAEHAGVCFGVKRALDLVFNAAQDEGPLHTLGPLIHNPQVVQKLSDSGVKVVKDVSEVESGRLVMPSHGVTREVLGAAEGAGLEIIDATCPFVAKVHRNVQALTRDGYTVVIVGDRGHSEVKGIMSAAGDGAIVISTPEEARERALCGRIGIVAQTTQTEERFGEIVRIISETARETKVFNTICTATRDRQQAVVKIAHNVDAMFVVGGRNSANTNRLAEICQATGVETHHIETADEIQDEWLVGKQVVGLTAGASTPQWLIDEVVEKLEGF
jgi:(E)-4-hydroxy-3-methyl-but-2-enyl pyrophosphate reductase